MGVRALAALLAIILAIRAFLLSRINIHWDELNLLSEVYRFLRGDLHAPFQTLHVRLLGFLAGARRDEIEEVVLGRSVAALFHLLTLAGWWVYLREKRSARAILASFVAVECVSEVIVHSMALRTDALIALVVPLALLLLRSGTALGALASGAAFGLAIVLNLKAALFVPVVWLMLYSEYPERVTARSLIAHFVALVALALSLYAFHSRGLGTLAYAPAARVGEVLAGFLSGSLVVGPGTLVGSMGENLAFWISVISAGIILGRRHGLQALAPLSGLLLLVVYRNAWPYFLPLVILPLVVVLSGLADELTEPKKRNAGLAALCLIVVSGGYHLSLLGEDQTQGQRAVVRTVHALFPGPVPYIDRCGMISSFPKVGPFLSSWELERYRKTGQPIFRELVARYQPRFLIQNTPLLVDTELVAGPSDSGHGLLEEDVHFLSMSFVPYIGPISVPGRRLLELMPLEEVEVEILVSGRYALPERYVVDGSPRSGPHLELAAGRHRIGCADPEGCPRGYLMLLPQGAPPSSTFLPFGSKLFRY